MHLLGLLYVAQAKCCLRPLPIYNIAASPRRNKLAHCLLIFLLQTDNLTLLQLCPFGNNSIRKSCWPPPLLLQSTPKWLRGCCHITDIGKPCRNKKLASKRVCRGPTDPVLAICLQPNPQNTALQDNASSHLPAAADYGCSCRKSRQGLRL